MKTNKFRGWDHRKSEMLYGVQRSIVWFDFLDYPQHYSLMQYIGMEDKDDVPIYEGDILENNTMDEEYCSPAVVAMSVYEEVQYSLYIKFQNPKPYHDALIREFNGITLWEEFPVSYFHKNNYKVIGNIFENPELLD